MSETKALLPAWVGAIVGVVVLFTGAFGAWHYLKRDPQVGEGGYSYCATDKSKTRFKAAFDKSQYARAAHLSAVDVLEAKDAGVDPGEAIRCEVVFLLNNGAKKPYRFSITPAPLGGYHLAGEPMESPESMAVTTQTAKHLEVTVQEKRVIPGDFLGKQLVSFLLHNSGPKNVAAVKGLVIFLDVFEKEVAAVGFSHTDPILAGQSVTWTGVRDYNEMIPPHRNFAALMEGKYKTRFEPEVVLFTDGTKLETARRQHSYDVLYGADFQQLPAK